MKIGIQLSSFRPLLTTPEQVSAVFSRLKAMGCRTVQLQWIDPATPADDIQKALEAQGIASVSVQDFYQTVLENKAYFDDLNRVTGGSWLCVSRIPERLKTRAGLDAYIRELKAMAAQTDALGQKLCFHPVSGDFAPIDGLDPVEYLLSAMPELAVCADLYHLHKAGKDLQHWLRRYAGRICMVHFKDFHMDDMGKEVLVPAGQGDIRWDGVVKTCAEIGVEYAFAEQERWQGDPFCRLAEALGWLQAELDAAQP